MKLGDSDGGNDGKFWVKLFPGHGLLFDDEPVFVFRAQDRHMHDVLTYYASLCDVGGEVGELVSDHVSSILDKAVEVTEWQSAHPTRVKDPD